MEDMIALYGDKILWTVGGIALVLIVILVVLILKRDKESVDLIVEDKQEAPVAEVEEALVVEVAPVVVKKEPAKKTKEAKAVVEVAPVVVKKEPAKKVKEVKEVVEVAPVVVKKEPAKKTKEVKEVEKLADKTDDYHVKLHKDGGWQVKRESSSKVLRKFVTQEEAMEFAKETATNQEVSAYVHQKDGKKRKIK